MPDNNKAFREELTGMERQLLNNLNMSNYTLPQRRLINAERVRRKKNQSQTQPNSAANNGHLPQSTPSASTDSQVPASSEKPKNTNSQSQQETVPESIPKSWYLFKEYHQTIARLVADTVFHAAIKKFEKKDERFLVGSFECSKGNCSKKWVSGKIPTIIRTYSRRDGKVGYNAQVYNQRCKKCQSLGIMTLDREIYAERVSRLLKIWKGDSVPFIAYEGKETKPHKQELCEGCNAGNCEVGARLNRYQGRLLKQER